jgi:ceramide glucosyltransferase
MFCKHLFSTCPAIPISLEPAVLLNLVLGGLALLSLLLLIWQWAAAARFPLHRTIPGPIQPRPVTLLKSLKGCDEHTESCLRSWFEQDWEGPIQILFAVASSEDPVCAVVRGLIAEFPDVEAELVICGPLAGPNAKMSKLAQLEARSRHERIVVSDADVRVPRHCVRDVVARLEDPDVGLVHCLYRLANPQTLAMRWEAMAINGDFWSQVLQAATLRPVDFALGAVMATRRADLSTVGGFAAFTDCLADDYQLGHRLARKGKKIHFSTVVAECWSGVMDWQEVWRHQVRWARTIRVCQPLPYFFSILSNPTLWPWLWLAITPGKTAAGFAAACALVRAGTAFDLQRRIGYRPPVLYALTMPFFKDLVQVWIWLMAFAGNSIDWRGSRMKVRADGTLEKLG